MLTVIGFIEQENWMYARHLNDDSFCSHSSNGGVCEQHHEPEPFFVKKKVKKKVEKEEVGSPDHEAHTEDHAYVASESFGMLSSWMTENDIVTAERCQHILNRQMPDREDQDAFFVWYRERSTGKQEKLRRELMLHWHIEAAAIKRKRKQERK